MSKTLVIQFTPRGERSTTKKILDAFLAKASGKTEVDVLDLDATPPALMLSKKLMPYIFRDYMGENTPENAAALTENDALIARLKAADYVVLAYPMWNFSFPAVVKAWFDAVLLKGHTWDMNETGYVGLLPGKKALIITSSGGDYAAMPTWEHSQSLGAVEFGFMGFAETNVVTAAGVNAKPDEADTITAKAIDEATAVAAKWYA